MRFSQTYVGHPGRCTSHVDVRIYVDVTMCEDVWICVNVWICAEVWICMDAWVREDVRIYVHERMRGYMLMLKT